MAGFNYCPSCGSKSQNTGITVKFCSSCGYSFMAATAPTPPPVAQKPVQAFVSKPREKFNRYTSTDVSEDDDIMFKDGLPQLSRSDVIVEGSTIKFRKISDLGSMPENDGPRNLPGQNLTDEQFKQQWKVEAGGKSSIEIE